MRATDTVVIGGGQAGLAMSRCLGELGIEHVVLERGRIAERWRSERWDSLRLLTPRWQSRLPSYGYTGPSPDGYMTKDELVSYLVRYARAFAAPVETETTVMRVEPDSRGYRVTTNRGTWLAQRVVVATGSCDTPLVPEAASALARGVRQLTASSYANPSSVPPGGVLVVGASASGVQIAEELARAGRDVVVAVGSHTSLPRSYRGRDVMWWMDRIGVLDEGADATRDLEAARRAPSLQLIGEPRSIDLEGLRALGVRLAGRLTAADGSDVAFASDLGTSVAASERRRARMLARIDAFVAASDLERVFPHEERRPPMIVPKTPAALDLRREKIATVLWATGYVRRYPWLHVPVFDARGEIRHRDGITSLPGLYVLGLRLQRTRKSSFLDGVGADARGLRIVEDRAELAQAPPQRAAWVVRDVPEERAEVLAPVLALGEHEIGEQRARLSRLGEREDTATAKHLELPEETELDRRVDLSHGPRR